MKNLNKEILKALKEQYSVDDPKDKEVSLKKLQKSLQCTERDLEEKLFLAAGLDTYKVHLYNLEKDLETLQKESPNSRIKLDNKNMLVVDLVRKYIKTIKENGNDKIYYRNVLLDTPVSCDSLEWKLQF